MNTARHPLITGDEGSLGRADRLQRELGRARRITFSPRRFPNGRKNEFQLIDAISAVSHSATMLVAILCRALQPDAGGTILGGAYDGNGTW